MKNHYEGELKKLEEQGVIVHSTEQELLWAKQHAQRLYDTSKIHNMTCLRLYSRSSP